MLKYLRTIFSVLLSLLVVFLTACSNRENNLSVINVYDAQHQAAVLLPQSPRFEKLLDECGKINTQFLENIKVSTIYKNYDNRVYIKYNDQSYFYNPVYISYDQILNNRVIPQERKTVVLEEAFAKAKESGFKTVALFIDWKCFYTGTSYDFNFYKIYYKLAEKYDLNISIVWNGYAKNGFMPWQTDQSKYPIKAINAKLNVPDLSQEIYINEAVEAITQFCAWLNYIDYNRRTIMIQLEDEANTNYGKGVWLSQYESYSNLILKMADAVKNSTYNLVTTVGLNLDDYRTTVEGVTGRDRLDKFLLYDNIDGIGAANLVSENFSTGNFANDNKFCYITKISPAPYTFFSTAMKLLSEGYQFGVYELKSFDLAVNCGMYRTHSTKWDARTRQILDRGILSKKRPYESHTLDVIDFIKGINNMGSALATANLLDIVVMNPSALNNYSMLSPIGDVKISFNNFSSTHAIYNSAALCVVDAYSNYYVFAFKQTPFLAIDCDNIVKISEGKIINGEWVADSKELSLDDHYFIMKSGVVYKFVLN